MAIVAFRHAESTFAGFASVAVAVVLSVVMKAGALGAAHNVGQAVEV